MAGAVTLSWAALIALVMGHGAELAAGLALTTVWALGLLVSYVVLFRFPGRATGAPRAVSTAVGLAVGLVVTVAAAVVTQLRGLTDVSEGHHVACFGISLLVAAGPMATFLATERGAEPVAPTSRGAALGAFAGAAAGLAMCFVCSHVDPVHMLAGHVTALFVSVAVGAVLGQRLLAMRG